MVDRKRSENKVFIQLVCLHTTIQYLVSNQQYPKLFIRPFALSLYFSNKQERESCKSMEELEEVGKEPTKFLP
jgi:hypothetical protein